MQYYNEEGEKVDAFSQEDLDTKITETKTEAEAKEKELNEELSKFRDKDFNFKALREAKEEEKKKMLGEMSDKEKKLFEEIESVKTENENFKSALTGSYKDEALKGISTDEETQKKILANYERISDAAITKEQVKGKMKEAYNMLGENEVDAINAVSGTQNAGDIKKPNVSDLTPETKKMANEFGLSDDDIKKFDK